MRLSALIEDIDAEAAGLKVIGMDDDFDVEVSSISLDSRELGGPGALFAALPGEITDGYDYIDAALSLGAVCILTEKIKEDAGVVQIIARDARAALASISETFYGAPAKKMRLVGITGTNGKTTTSYIIEAIFKAAGLSCGVIGTVNYRYDDVVEKSEHTTPESIDLSRVLADMVAAGVSHVVVEVSSHALKQKRADGCRFSSAVFTNLTHEHLDYHHSMENYFMSKERLFKELMKEDGTPVLNIDDHWGRALALELSGAVTFSLSKETDGTVADIFPKEYSADARGIRAVLSTPGGEILVESALVGDHNLSNIMAAVGTALSLDIDAGAIASGINALKSVPGRLELIEDEKESARFMVDYAHTADALSRALTALRKITPDKGRLITVFGCGGDRDRAKRPFMGEVATRLSDIAIITSDNPRGEDPVKIIADIEAGVKDVRRYGDNEEIDGPGFMVIVDRREAIRMAVALAEVNDTVLIAGKGHEDYQLVGKESFSFDDREELRLALKERSSSLGARH